MSVQENKKMDNPILDALTIKESVSKRTNEALQKALEIQIREEMKRIIKEDNDEEEVVIDDEEEFDTTVEPEVDAETDEVDAVGSDEEEVILDDEEMPVGDEEGFEGMEDFEVDDNTFDVRSDDEAAIKIFKNVTDSDQIIITKDGDDIEISDQETGVDYLIDLGDACDDAPIEEANFKLEPTPAAKKDIFKGGGPNASIPSGKKSLGTNDTPNKYGKVGDGDPFNESSNASQPFTEPLTEEEDMEIEENVTLPYPNTARQTKKPENMKGRSHAKVKGGYRDGGKEVVKEEVAEKIARLENKVKKMSDENAILKETVKQLRECAQQFYVTVKETALTNQKLGKVIQLFSEHATTLDEKKSIVERFEGHKTEKDIQSLYETIKKELKVRKPVLSESIDKSFNNIVTEMKTTSQPAVVNEDVQKMLSLMNRICS